MASCKSALISPVKSTEISIVNRKRGKTDNLWLAEKNVGLVIRRES